MLVVRSFQLCDFLVRRNALNCLRLLIFVFVHQDIFHFLFTPRELTLVLSSMNPHDRFTLLFKEEMDAPDPIPDLNKVRDRGEGVTVSGRAHSPHTSLYALPIVRYYPLSYIRTYVPGTGVLEEHDEVMDGDLTPLHQARLIGMSDDATLNVTSKPESAPSEDSATIVPYRSTVSSDAKVPLSFTPALALAHFPYKHLRGDLAKRISQEFYEGGKFWQRTWDLYVNNTELG
jgi:hypothetical protein